MSLHFLFKSPPLRHRKEGDWADEFRFHDRDCDDLASMQFSSMSIAELESKVRDRINRGRTQHRLLSRPADWNRLCSSLDIVGDAEMGLEAYLKQPDISDTGLCYVHVYGALQLLQVQQDAVSHICAALGIKAQTSPKLPHIREIRSSSVGHPAQQKENHATKSHFIAQSSLTKTGFMLTTVHSDGKPFKQRHIDIPKLITEQRITVRKVLEEILTQMDEAELKHRSQHRDEKLNNVFPEILSYWFEKIFQAIRDPVYRSMGLSYLESIGDRLALLKQLLEKRGEWGIYESVNYQYELLEYPLDELKSYFADQSDSKLNDKDANIFCAFLQKELQNLQGIMREIDIEYSENPFEEGAR